MIAKDEFAAEKRIPLLSQESGLTGGKKMNKHVATMDVQQEIDPKQFVRRLGIKPLKGRLRCSWPDQLDLFYRAFGPPETDRRHSSVLFWNFVESDGTPSFSLSVKSPGGRDVCLVSRRQSDIPYLWTSDRIGDVEREPIFLGAERFVISRAS
jgi:hypothetical protein